MRTLAFAATTFAAVVTATVIATAQVVAAGDERRGDQPRPVLQRATLMISAAVGNRFFAHVWHAPSSTGGRCSFVTTDHRRTAHGPRNMNGGGACASGRDATPTRARPLEVGLSISRRPQRGNPESWVPPIVWGTVARRLRVVRVVIRWRGGSRDLKLRGAHFLGGGTYLYMPPLKAFPFSVIAYDAAGSQVARQRLNNPSLLLLRGGWKEYTRLYRHWKARHK